MSVLPIELWQLILDFCPLQTQLALFQVNKFLHQRLQITDFYHISAKLKSKLTDQILKRYHHIKYLDAAWNGKITDEGIKHMQLHTLNATSSPFITDQGIKHMNLHTLDASSNYRITDQGIKHMNLYSLSAFYNKMITDQGIGGKTTKHMYLHTLDASANRFITDQGIVSFCLPFALRLPFLSILIAQQ